MPFFTTVASTLRALHHGSAELGVLTVHDGEDLIENHGVAGVHVQLLDEQSVTLADVVLLASGHDNSLHKLLHLPFLYYGLAVGGVRQSRSLLTHSKRLIKYNSAVPRCQQEMALFLRKNP